MKTILSALVLLGLCYAKVSCSITWKISIMGVCYYSAEYGILFLAFSDSNVLELVFILTYPLQGPRMHPYLCMYSLTVPGSEWLDYANTL